MLTGSHFVVVVLRVREKVVRRCFEHGRCRRRVLGHEHAEPEQVVQRPARLRHLGGELFWRELLFLVGQQIDRLVAQQLLDASETRAALVSVDQTAGVRRASF